MHHESQKRVMRDAYWVIGIRLTALDYRCSDIGLWGQGIPPRVSTSVQDLRRNLFCPRGNGGLNWPKKSRGAWDWQRSEAARPTYGRRRPYWAASPVFLFFLAPSCVQTMK